MKKAPYQIDYSPEAVDHLDGLTGRQAAMVLDVVARQLSHEPARATRNRYYELQDDRDRVVVVKAVGIKDRDRVRIGGQEVEL